MRGFWGVALFGLVGCAGPAAELGEDMPSVARSGAVNGHSASADSSSASTGGPFMGAWASCEGPSSPDECSRYVLVQRGERICGTWFYLASGQEYEGRVMARATSSIEARRTHVCGRPGSETDIECSDGWQRIDRPLRLCDGRLSDLGAGGRECFADYRPLTISQAERDALKQEPWLQTCLSEHP